MPAKLESCVAKVQAQLVKKGKSEKVARQSAYAICNASLNPQEGARWFQLDGQYFFVDPETFDVTKVTEGEVPSIETVYRLVEGRKIQEAKKGKPAFLKKLMKKKMKASEDEEEDESEAEEEDGAEEEDEAVGYPGKKGQGSSMKASEDEEEDEEEADAEDEDEAEEEDESEADAEDEEESEDQAEDEDEAEEEDEAAGFPGVKGVKKHSYGKGIDPSHTSKGGGKKSKYFSGKGAIGEDEEEDESEADAEDEEEVANIKRKIPVRPGDKFAQKKSGGGKFFNKKGKGIVRAGEDEEEDESESGDEDEEEARRPKGKR